MNKELYKSEVNTLQNLIKKITSAEPNVEEKTGTSTSNRDFVILVIIILLLVIGGVGYLTYWLLH